MRDPDGGHSREVTLEEMRMKIQVQIDFVNMNQTLGSLMPGGSFSIYLKHSTIWASFQAVIIPIPGAQ